MIENCPKCHMVQPTGHFARPYCPYCVGKWVREHEPGWGLRRWLAYRLMPKQWKTILDFYIGLTSPWVPHVLMREEEEAKR